MGRIAKWFILISVVLLLLIASALLVLDRWLSSDDFRLRVQREASVALGVPVTLKRLGFSLWPLPALTLDGAQVQASKSITAGRIELRPQWRGLLRREPQIDSLLLRDVQLPELALQGLFATLEKSSAAAGKASPPPLQQAKPPGWLPRRIVLQNLSWIDAKGTAWSLDADVLLGAEHLPETLELKLIDGRWKGAQLELRRDRTRQVQDETANWPAWAVQAKLAGGSIQGRLAARLALGSGADGGAVSVPVPAHEAWAIQGQFETHNLEMAQLLAPRPALTGRLEASTRLQARSAQPATLLDAAVSHTSFQVKDAVLQGIDLARAVTTVGLHRGGQTALDTLAGRLSTRGRQLQLSNLVATSGVLSASGQVNVSATRALDGQVSVDIAKGVVGVPLLVAGTLDQPTVSLSRSAVLGAAIGTALLPGLGTGAGAKLGDKIGQGLKGFFGDRK